MSKQLFKALLNYEFFYKVAYKVSEDFFPSELHSLYRTLVTSHEKYKKNLSLCELRDVHFANNPVASQSSKLAIQELISTLEKEPDYSEDIAFDVLEKAWRSELARQVMAKACEVVEGKQDNFNEVLQLIEKTSNQSAVKKFEDFTLDELETVLASSTMNYKWKWNLEKLQQATGGFPEASFGIIAARPEAGKSALWVSLACSTGGWIDQGAKVHIWRNEERYQQVLTRCACATLNVDKHGVILRLPELKAKWQVNKPIIVKPEYSENCSIDDIDQYLTEHLDADILIIDQIDKVLYNGQSVYTDRHVMRELYIQARSLAKKHNVAIIAITQAGSGAEGRLYYGFNDLDESKTSKAAEADYIFCIGMNKPEGGTEDTGYRIINFAKNKLSGPQKPIDYVLRHDVTRCVA